MKKKRIVLLASLASLLLVSGCDGNPLLSSIPPSTSTTTSSQTPSSSQPTSSKDPSSTGPNSSTGPVSSVDPSSPSNPSSPDDPDSPYVTETLKNGFSVQEGIPNENGDITAERLYDFMTILGRFYGGTDPWPESEKESILSQMEEGIVPLLSQGGVTNDYADAIEEILTADEEYPALLQSIMGGDTSGFTQANFEKIGKVLQDVIYATTEDQFASIALFFLSMTFSGNIGQSSVRAFGILSVQMLEEILKLATGDVLSFFKGVYDNSDFGMDTAAVNAILISEEARWYAGRIAYNMVKAILDKMGPANLATMALEFIQFFQDPAFAESEGMVSLLNKVGRVLDECFLDRASFKKLAEYVSSSVHAMKDYGKESAAHQSFQGLYPTAFAYNQTMDETFQDLAENSDKAFNGLKFVATMAKNFTKDDLDSAISLVKTIQGSENFEETDLSTDVVRISKIFVANVTRFSTDKDAVQEGFAYLFEKVWQIITIANGDQANLGNGFRFRYYDLVIQEGLMEDLIDKIETYSGMDIASLTDAEKKEINDTIKEKVTTFMDGARTISYDLVVNYRYNVNEQPQPSLRKVVTDGNGMPIDGEGFYKEIPASSIKNFSSASARMNVAWFEEDGVTFFFSYVVGLGDIRYARVESEWGNNLVRQGTPAEEMPPISVQYDDSMEYVDLDQVTGYSSDTVGVNYAYIKDAGGYYVLPYYVYDPQDETTIYSIGGEIYQGMLATGAFDAVTFKHLEVEELQLSASVPIDNRQIYATLDTSKVGTNQYEYTFVDDDGTPKTQTYTYEVLPAVKATIGFEIYLDHPYMIDGRIFVQGTDDFFAMDQAVDSNSFSLCNEIDLESGEHISLPIDAEYVWNGQPENLTLNDLGVSTENEGRFETALTGTVDIKTYDDSGEATGTHTVSELSFCYEVLGGVEMQTNVSPNPLFVRFDSYGKVIDGKDYSLEIEFYRYDEQIGYSHCYISPWDLDEETQAALWNALPTQDVGTYDFVWQYVDSSRCLILDVPVMYEIVEA